MDPSPLPAQALTVHELVKSIRENLEEGFSSVWVTGEISNLRTPHSGHTYFTLKDADAQIQAVFFKFKQKYIRFEPEDGMQVLCKGTITVYEVRGTVQVNIDYMEPAGLGALTLAFEQVKERLEKEGLFDPVHKKEIPLVPGKIGVITSPTGAAIQDILHVITRRFANVEILIAPVHVQGDQAVPEIIDALQRFNQRGDLDVIILSRGGGSIEDLWSFNDEHVALAIFKSTVPIISAIGHETDFTIADFVADLRAPTPSAAAELVVQNKSEIMEKVENLKTRLKKQALNSLERKQSEIEILQHRLVSPERRIGMVQQRLDDLYDSMERTLHHSVESQRKRLQTSSSSLRILNPIAKTRRLKESLLQRFKKLQRDIGIVLNVKNDRLASLTSKLDALSPLKVLQRGYSIVYKIPDGPVVRDSCEISLGDRLKIRFHRGEAISKVEKVNKGKNPR